jgi:hypothetical protein
MISICHKIADLHDMSRPSERASTPGRSAKTLPVVGLLSVGLAVAAALFGHRLDAERDRSAALQSQVKRLVAENSALLAHLERQGASGRLGSGMGARTPMSPPPAASGDPVPAERPSGLASPALAQPRTGDGATRGVAPGPNALPIGSNADRLGALHDPATRDAMRRQQSAAMRRMYPDLAESLGLSRENADRFIEMQVEQQLRKVDESLRLAASGGARSSTEMKDAGRRMAEAQRDAERELAAQFGPDVLQNWKTYQQGLGARMELRGLQLELADAGMALTLPQRDALVAAMLREQQTSGNAGSKKLTTEARIDQAAASFERLQDAARAVLNAEQLARFDARQRQRLHIMTAAGETSGSRSPTP